MSERDPVKHRPKKEGKCTICPWKGQTHNHRHEPEKGYTRENVVEICPNDHTDIHDIIERTNKGEYIPFWPTRPTKKLYEQRSLRRYYDFNARWVKKRPIDTRTILRENEEGFHQTTSQGGNAERIHAIREEETARTRPVDGIQN